MNTTTTSPDQLKDLVRKQYGDIARAAAAPTADTCCGTNCGCATMAEDYTNAPGYDPNADLGLGCGLPVEHSFINEGDTVVDLGAGAGNDAFVARSIVGSAGKVIGIDFTDAMIEKARKNAARMKYENVHFLKGDIENTPLEDNSANVVVSNCVFNLVPDKARAFAETFRILKPGGHFSISDVVVTGELSDEARQSAELYVGCISGAIMKEDYLAIIRKTGFKNVRIEKEKSIELPDEIMSTPAGSLTSTAVEKPGVLSITVYGEKPSPCCGPDCCS